MLDETDITIIPTMNPDGFDRGTEGSCSGADYKTGRYNEGNIDLNRNFPTWADVGKTREELFDGREPETQAIMRLILDHPWVMSANFHDGAVVASYPYDDYQGTGQQSGISKTPDQSFFHHLASTYATNHQTMLDTSICSRWYFKDGITNGADWYALYGGMQDFNYIFTNDFEITLELSCCKYPRKYYLNKEWERNKRSMLEYLKQVHRGVKGLVYTSYHDDITKDELTVQSNAVVSVTNSGGDLIRKQVSSSDRGEYWRLLMPGQYWIQAHLDMCQEAGLIMASEKIQVSLTDQEPLINLDLVMNTTLYDCNDLTDTSEEDDDKDEKEEEDEKCMLKIFNICL